MGLDNLQGIHHPQEPQEQPIEIGPMGAFALALSYLATKLPPEDHLNKTLTDLNQLSGEIEFTERQLEEIKVIKTNLETSLTRSQAQLAALVTPELFKSVIHTALVTAAKADDYNALKYLVNSINPQQEEPILEEEIEIGPEELSPSPSAESTSLTGITADQALGNILSSRPQPIPPPATPTVEIIEQTPGSKKPTITWKEVLGEKATQNEKNNVSMALTRFLKAAIDKASTDAYEKYLNNPLLFVEAISSMNPQELADLKDALICVFPIAKSTITLARILAVIHQRRSGEIKPVKDFMEAAGKLQSKQTEDSSPGTSTKPCGESPTVPVEGQTSPIHPTTLTKKEKVRKEKKIGGLSDSDMIGIIKQALGHFERSVKAHGDEKNIQWPMSGARLVNYSSRFTDTVVTNAEARRFISFVKKDKAPLIEEVEMVILYFLTLSYDERHDTRTIKKIIQRIEELFPQAKTQYEQEKLVKEESPPKKYNNH